MPDVFIWYHADQQLEPALIDWIDCVETEAGVRGKLYIRTRQDKTTFMESYSDVSRATIDRIEKLAASSSLFQNIDRRCESFIQITPCPRPKNLAHC